MPYSGLPQNHKTWIPMSHKLYDITLYYYSQTYNEGDLAFRQNLVSDLYVLFLDNYKPKGTTRISVTLKDEDHITGYAGSILCVYAYLNDDLSWIIIVVSTSIK